jgi:hypothetical protein
VANQLSGELSAIHDEFVGELRGIREFARPTEGGTTNVLSGRARIAAANGATLLLAALYEECIRQMVRSVFNFRRSSPKGRAEFPEKLPSAIWRRSLELLARKQFDDLVRDGSQTDAYLRNVVTFCIKGDLSADVASAVAHNDNNMRPEEMGKLFNQIGITGIVSKLGESPPIQAYFAVDNPGIAGENTRSALEDFFRRRNEIAHAIQIGASDGPASLAKDVDFFEAVSSGLVHALGREFAEPSRKSRKAKRRSQPTADPPATPARRGHRRRGR